MGTRGVLTVQCLTCDSTSLIPRFELRRYQIIACARCGVLYNQTYYEDSHFRENLFEKGYYEHVHSTAFENRLEQFEKDPSVKVYQKYLKHIERTKTPGRVLDVGCAFGTFLKVASTRNWQPWGVEFSKYSSEQARKTWGFEIFNGDLNDCPFEEDTFDLVTFWDVIEHVPNPRKNLEKARALLKKGGYLLITTDNCSSLISFMASALYKLSMGHFKYPVERFFIPYNTCYFKPTNMKGLLASCGFKPIYFEMIDYPLEKMNLSKAEKICVGALYKLGDLVDLNSQFIVIAEKL
jgi:2-polyprenyl-3-methyl-5-hydroxy-6-metoxy-1,4-benzoquinol methylase